VQFDATEEDDAAEVLEEGRQPKPAELSFIVESEEHKAGDFGQDDELPKPLGSVLGILSPIPRLDAGEHPSATQVAELHS
jgi:hypothetical protein